VKQVPVGAVYLSPRLETHIGRSVALLLVLGVASPAMRFSASTQPGKVLDLFAGAGGWEVGLRGLGLSAVGVETDAWACATARAGGHERLQADVTVVDPHGFSPVWGLIGSPPCQAYSTAGKGLGRADRPLVIACAHELAAGHDSRAARLRECRDARSLLTVEPLRFALALKPRWIALEQVPPVLELWSVFAGLLSAHGYESAVGVLSAERYGVPQTRRRAFLIASLDGPVSLPDPTHRSYNARRRETPADELVLEPWVSMAEALGWAVSRGAGFPRRGGWAWRNGNQPNSTVRAAGEPAPTVHFGHRPSQVAWVPGHYDARQAGARPRPVSRPAPTMLASGLAKGTPVWALKRPATTVACDARVCRPGGKRNASSPGAPGRCEGAVRVTVRQAAVLQGFPARYPWRGPRTRQFEQVGNAVPPPLARRVLEQAIGPSKKDIGRGKRGGVR
jgi:DNA (cytosine-5)-methyltransferase 1